MNQEEFVSLKDFFTTLLHEHEKRFQVKLDSMDKALELGKKEMDRRLGELNNLRAEVTSDRDQYVRKELCDKTEDSTEKWRESVNERLTTLETKIITWTLAMGGFLSILGVFLKIFKII